MTLKLWKLIKPFETQTYANQTFFASTQLVQYPRIVAESENFTELKY